MSPEEMGSRLLYRDGLCLIIDKPAGLPVHAGPGGGANLEQYLDARVEEAVAPFSARLPSEKLEFMRSSLRAELESDPVLVELVRRATSNAASNEP